MKIIEREPVTDRTIHLTSAIAIVLTLSIGCRHSENPKTSITPAEQDRDSLPQVPSGDASATEPRTGVATDPPPNVKMDRDGVIAEAEQLQHQGDVRGAESVLRSLLLVDPHDDEILFRMANLAAGRGDLAEAIEVLKTIPADHPESGLPALGQAADWSLQLGRYQDAEHGYLKILEQIPQAAPAHRKLAFLYNRQGRRHEAVEHVRHLCRQGNVRQDELHSLMRPSDAMYDPPSDAPAAPDQHLYYPIGVSGEARKLFMDENFQAAVDVLRDSVEADQQPPSIVAFFGRAAAEAQDDVSFHWWLGKVDARTKQFSEYWAAIGTYWWTQRKPEQAARALLEALDREPTDFRSIVRLRAALEALGHGEDAEQWSERWKTLRDVSQVNNRIADAPQPDIAAMVKLATLLESLDRRLESVLWKSLAAHYQRAPRNVLQVLQSELVRLVQSEQGFPETTVKLCGMRLDAFPLPAMNLTETNIPTPTARSVPAPHDSVEPRFENVAANVGLTHAFHVASSTQDRGFSVYQSVGGAVAVIDYDLDGQTDLYFTQGGADPPMFIGHQSNVLYRQTEGKLVDVTGHAGAQQNRYSTGVTVGDWNQDGFADLVVANVGQNSLWINSGDGTFRPVNFDDRDDKTILTTSLAMADLSGDALPDVFELNYLHDPAFSKRPAVNKLGQIVGYLKPAEFNPGTDRWITNDGKGQASFRLIGDPETAAASGLGVVVGDFDDRHPGNEVFVGNDTDPNQLWVRGNGTDENPWSDVAMSRGCAFGFDGVPTASMGVAAGDFDQNGALDFHVTNFQDENASLFLNRDGMYQDRNVGFGLAGPSSSVLGFGTQAIDYNNDGTLDLVVTNGHIEQSAAIPDPFEQPPQLFRNLGNRFELCDVSDPSGYWSDRHVGRGLARLDFNRDGKMDVVVTHLGETSALLINRTAAQNHWIQIQLVGTQSERDAIGAKVDVQVGDRSLSQWVVAGDGFFCRNEAILAFGLGDRQQVDQLSIRWPSGRRQQLNHLAADRRLLIVEGDPEPFERW
ncbi:RNA-binding protein [Rhodopirellula sp. SM50]|nr:RNA-binding protein [Rhodopirellula sp. SM50]